MSPSNPPSHEQTEIPGQINKNIKQFNKFLQKNKEVLQQKYIQHFAQQKIKITASTPNIETVVNFISDVFMFQDNQTKNKSKQVSKSEEKLKIHESLKLSYQGFIKANKQLKEFNSQVAIQLLRYCIDRNQMFAVQYQSAIKDNEQATTSITHKKQSNQNNVQPHENHDQKSNKQGEMENNSSMNQFADMKGRPSNKFQHNQNSSETSSPTYNINKQKMQNSFDQGELQNQFNFREEIKLEMDPILVKRNLKIVFDYYCKQQMSLAPNLSFDRIQRESHMMTLGKMLLMARMMNVVNGVITKEIITSKFRKISQGKKQIDFRQFDILMSQLQVEDSTLLARAQLNSPSIQLYLKTTKKAFDTQDLLPRELIKQRMFANKITAHSGKMEIDLLQDLKNKKKLTEGQNNNNIIRYSFSKMLSKQQAKSRISQGKNQKQISKIKEMRHYLDKRQSQIINPKHLNKRQRYFSQDLPLSKLKKIIPAQQQDQKWLGQYKINSSIKKARAIDDSLQKKRSFEQLQRNSNLIRDLKNRVKQIQKSQSYESGFDDTKPYLASPIRKH